MRSRSDTKMHPKTHQLILASTAASVRLAAALFTRPSCSSSPSCKMAHAAASHASSDVSKVPGTARIMLTGDVMLGRGVDQVLPHHCTPVLFESCVRDARVYVQLAVAANGPLPPNRGFEYPWGIALADMQAKQPDAQVINLETAVTTSPEAWPGKGINYRMHPGNVLALTVACVDVCCLANNHSLDWGMSGLLETLDVLQGAGMKTAGAGRNLEEAEAPAVLVLPPASVSSSGQGGGRLLVWAIGHSSSGVPDAWAAGHSKPGVFAADLSPDGARRLAGLVRKHKHPGDIALVSVHWGSNWGFGVPQEQRRFAHELIDDAGVDVVHGHSSHHLKGAEVYHGRLAIYGCGDLISDYEGITNSAIEATFPHEEYRDDVGAIWYADVSREDGHLHQLVLTPTHLKKLSLYRPDAADLRHLTRVLDRECGRLGGLAKARLSADGRSLLLAPALVPEE